MSRREKYFVEVEAQEENPVREKKKKYNKNESHMAQAKQQDDSESDSDGEAVVLMTTTCNFSSNGDSETWYLDTGCSNHMTCNLSWLVSLDDSKKCTIKFADHSTIKSVGIGNVAFRKSNGSLAVGGGSGL